jgi:hypothetical protein
MRVTFYKTIYSIILVNQRFLFQNSVPLMQQTHPSEFSTPSSRVGSQVLLWSRWRRLKPSQHCTVTCLKTSHRFSISISGTSRNHTVANLAWKLMQWQGCVWGRFVVMKLNGFQREQFSIQLSSPSFSNSSGLQDNIFYLLWHQAVRTLYELTSKNRDKIIIYLIFDFLIEISSVLETMEWAISHSASWFQGRIRITNFRHQLWLDYESVSIRSSITNSRDLGTTREATGSAATR